MIRLSSKLIQYGCNLTKINQQLRALSITQSQVPSTNQIQSCLVPKLNHDELHQKLPSLNPIGDKPHNQITPILDTYNNSLGIISNYRQVYIHNPALPLDAPAANKSNEVIQAARLIVIRRRKMKKHKLKKLRKKMKFEWAKVRQKREMRKEKAFQAVLINQIKEAEKFSAEAYVVDKIRKANEVPIPRLWKGKRLPAFVIKEKL